MSISVVIVGYGGQDELVARAIAVDRRPDLTRPPARAGRPQVFRTSPSTDRSDWVRPSRSRLPRAGRPETRN